MIFYDFEVFRHDWLVVLMGSDGAVTRIHNDSEALSGYYAGHAGDIWVGYNSRNYDRWILRAVILGIDPWKVNDWIINQHRQGWEYSDAFREIPLQDYDCYTGFHGLKTLEAFMGHDIRETSVPFDVDRPLTEREVEETFEYCEHDVKETAEVFIRRQADFKAHLELLKSFGLPLSDISKTKAQLIAKILGAERRERRDEFALRFPETLRLDRYEAVQEWYCDPANLDYGKSLAAEVAGVPTVFAWGGVHGALPKYHGRGKFWMIDVASLYPSLMIRYGFLSRSVREPERYREIYETNLAMKATKDPRRPAYKLVCNTTYGCMKDRYNAVYDRPMANCVCVAGQLLLLDLMEHLEGLCDLIQSNTDGLLVRLRDGGEKVREAVSEWESRTGLTMEFTEFSEVWQKDVNNYLALMPDGKAKSKGAYVKKLSDLDNDLPIVNRALRSLMVSGTPIRETIERCEDLVEFQKVVHVSSKYLYATFCGKRQADRTFRVFASRTIGGPICKVKREGGTQEKFANTPEKCFIANGDVRGLGIPVRLDKEWYIALAESRAKEFGI